MRSVEPAAERQLVQRTDRLRLGFLHARLLPWSRGSRRRVHHLGGLRCRFLLHSRCRKGHMQHELSVKIRLTRWDGQNLRPEQSRSTQGLAEIRWGRALRASTSGGAGRKGARGARSRGAAGPGSAAPTRSARGTNQEKRLLMASITSPYFGGSMTGGLASVDFTPGMAPS